eukprot:EC120159.1.p1 GENE.EC120159.1~~EC120159.1.p1  ORF type:complete len:124 (-),score=15.19 EC120159.1:38-409(-)
MSGLISTELKVLPLYTPTTLPIISGTMIMFRRCVLITSGLSPKAASRFAFRRRSDEGHGLALQTTREASPSACIDEVHELLAAEIKQCIEIDAAEGKLLESPLLGLRTTSFVLHFGDTRWIHS